MSSESQKPQDKPQGSTREECYSFDEIVYLPLKGGLSVGHTCTRTVFSNIRELPPTLDAHSSQWRASSQKSPSTNENSSTEAAAGLATPPLPTPDTSGSPTALPEANNPVDSFSTPILGETDLRELE